jgi:hypothetical protein
MNLALGEAQILTKEGSAIFESNLFLKENNLGLF